MANFSALGMQPHPLHPMSYAYGRTRYLSQTEGPSLQFFSEERPANVLAQLALHATQYLLTDCRDRLTRFSVQYRPSKKCKI